MDKIGLKRFFYFQFVSKDNVKDVFRLTLYKSKPNKLLIFNGVIKIKRLGRVYPRVRTTGYIGFGLCPRAVFSSPVFQNGSKCGFRIETVSRYQKIYSKVLVFIMVA